MEGEDLVAPSQECFGEILGFGEGVPAGGVDEGSEGLVGVLFGLGDVDAVEVLEQLTGDGEFGPVQPNRHTTACHQGPSLTRRFRHHRVSRGSGRQPSIISYRSPTSPRSLHYWLKTCSTSRAGASFRLRRRRWMSRSTAFRVPRCEDGQHVHRPTLERQRWILALRA